MRILSSFFMALAMLFVSHGVIAQTVKDRTTQKTQNETNRRIDNKIDQGVNKGLDAIEGVFKKKPAQQQETVGQYEEDEDMPSAEQMALFSKMFGGDAKFEKSYQFDYAYSMEILSRKGSKKEGEMQYEMGGARNNECFLMEMVSVDGKKQSPRSRVVFDHINKSMVSLMDEGKERNGMAMSFDPESVMTDSFDMNNAEETRVDNFSFRKTGQSKTMNGYHCEQYTFKGDDGEGEMWVATDKSLPEFVMFGMVNFGNKKSTVPGLTGYPEGFLMEVISIDYKTKEHTEMRVTSIDLNKKQTLSTEGYQILSMGSMMGQ